MNSVQFFVPGLPITEGSTRAFMRGGRPVVTHDRQVELAVWRARVRAASIDAAEAAEWSIEYDGPVKVQAAFHLPRPKRPKHAIYASTKPDLDKLQRAIGDSLAPYRQTGILKEDSRIVKWNAEKTWATKPELVGALITVSAL